MQATLPAWRRQSLAAWLAARLEAEGTERCMFHVQGNISRRHLRHAPSVVPRHRQVQGGQLQQVSRQGPSANEATMMIFDVDLHVCASLTICLQHSGCMRLPVLPQSPTTKLGHVNRPAKGEYCDIVDGITVCSRLAKGFRAGHNTNLAGHVTLTDARL